MSGVVSLGALDAVRDGEAILEGAGGLDKAAVVPVAPADSGP